MNEFASVIIMVQVVSVSSFSRSCHSLHKPAIVKIGLSGRRDVVRLLPIWSGLPLVVPRRRDQAAGAPERVAKHRLLGDRFRPSVEGHRQTVVDFEQCAAGVPGRQKVQMAHGQF